AAILSIYAVANWLSKMTAAGQKYEINVLTFSASTQATGWCDAAQIRSRLRETVFRPQCSGTVLPAAPLRAQLREEVATLTLLISDGDICNEAEVFMDVFSDPEICERNLLVML